jgi:putative inorganic carbon (hco3(-)) transporter
VTIGRDFHSPIGDPNDLALVLLFPLGFAIAFAGHKCGLVNRLLGLAAIPTILAAIVFTQSRGGLIGVLAVVAASALRMFKVKTMIAVVGVAVAFVLFSSLQISTRPDISATTAAIDESSMDRLYAWRAAVNMAIARPLTGVGLSNFSDSIYFYTERWATFRDMVAHSTWFTVLGETGFPGAILFVAMIVSTFLSANRSTRLLNSSGAPEIMRAIAPALISALAGFCAAGTFLTQTFTWPIYILVALTVGVRRIADDFAASRSPSQSAQAPGRHI